MVHEYLRQLGYVPTFVLLVVDCVKVINNMAELITSKVIANQTKGKLHSAQRPPEKE